MTGSVQAPAVPVRQRLLDEASKMFRTEGFEATSIDAIGAAAGVTGPALYYHFGSKTGLLHELLVSQFSDLYERVNDAVTGQAPARQLTSFVREHILYSLERFIYPEVPGAILVGTNTLVRSLPPEDRTTILELAHRHLDSLRRVLRRGQASGDFPSFPVTPMAFAIIGMADTVVTWWRPEREMSMHAIAEFHGRLALGMVMSCATGD